MWAGTGTGCWPWALGLALLLPALLASSAAPAAGISRVELRSGVLQVAVDLATGNYAVAVGTPAVAWFDSLPYEFSADNQVFTSANQSLVLVSAAADPPGADRNGAFDAVTLGWARQGAPAVGTPEFRTTFKAYTADPAIGLTRSALAFKQTWLKGATGTLGSAFPSILKSATAPELLGSLEYTGTSCGWMVGHKGSLAITGGKSKGMVVLAPHDAVGSGANATLVLGPVAEMFANQARSVAHGQGIAYGLSSSFESVPTGYVLETVLVASAKGDSSPGAEQPERASSPKGGVNAALFEYGDFVLARHAKQRTSADHNNEVAYLGYSTTGFYFYNLCDCLDEADNIYKRTTCKNSTIPGCKSYADTLVAVVKALNRDRIPVRHILLDSWWYGENFYDGVWLWEDKITRNISFPDGMLAFWDAIGTNITIWGHNGKWNSNTPYKKTYEFNGDYPQGPGLWDYVFSQNRKWGLQTIKQDHMGQQMGGAEGWRNVTVLKSWLAGMGDAAARNGVGILYCCAPPNVHMNGVTVPAAFGVRASPDYVWQAQGRVLKLPQVQWAIGPDSAYHWNALGLLPYKDTFFSNSSGTPKAGTWTSDPKQWVPFTGFHEALPATHALMATLSMAQVTFSDGVGMANRTLLDMICRKDGLVLKPDRPATAIDAQFQAMMFGAWPGPGPVPPSPGHGSVYATACNASDPRQLWTQDERTGALSIDEPDTGAAACLDISHCDKAAGSAVRLFHNAAGCGKPPGTCDGENEWWNFTAHDTLRSPYALMCLSATAGGAEMATCGTDPAATAATTWVASPASGHKLLIKQGVGSSTCLAGGPIAPGPSAPTPQSRNRSPNAVPPQEAFARLSSSYRSALEISDRLVESIEARREAAQCLASPQSPQGEVYSTHASVPVTGGSQATWFYAVGVQLVTPLALTPAHLNADMANTTLHAVQWDDARGFRTERPGSPFDAGHPITLTASGSPADLYPVQYHVVCPVLAGWVLVGEGGKFLPVSRQRIVSVSPTAGAGGGTGGSGGTGLQVLVKGAAGEVVEMSAYRANSTTVAHAECQIPPSGGQCTIAFPGH